MKVVFDQARSKEKSFAGLMKNLCFSLRISLNKKRRLVAELEEMVGRGEEASPLEHMREIVARDSVLLGDLEKLLARDQVGFGVRHVPSKLAEFLKEIQTKDGETVAKLQILERKMELNAISCSYECTVLAMGEFGYGLQISKCRKSASHWVHDLKADSTRLRDKMKFWFTRARTKDEGLAGVLRDLSFEIRITMQKSQRLIAGLEALGERGDVIIARGVIGSGCQIVARDSAKLAVLEQLLAGTHVVIRLKEGYVADME
ncbi:hypothetical protein Tco_0458241 [Tanacetum coccineum]